MHSKFLEYLNADEPEGVGLAELRVPWITPRRRKAAEAGTLRACQAMRKSMPPHVKYRAVNMPACAVATFEPHAEDSQVLHGIVLNPRGQTGCGARHSSHEGWGRLRGKVPVEREHGTFMNDTKCTASKPARMPPSPTRASNPRTQQPGEPQSASKIFSDMKEQLTNQQRVLDDRLQVQTRIPSFSCCFACLCLIVSRKCCRLY